MNSMIEYSLPHGRGSVIMKDIPSGLESQKYFRLQDGVLYISKSKNSSADQTFYLYNCTVNWRDSCEIQVLVKHASISFVLKSKDMSDATLLHTALKMSSVWKLRDFYRVGDFLGAGSFGKVYAAERTSDRMRVAIKGIPRNNFVNFVEVIILLKLDHRNIIRAVDVIHTARGVYVVVPQMDQDLGAWIEKSGALSEKDAHDVIRQLLSGLMYLQEKGIIHKDLKPENVLFKRTENSIEVKIADFGLSKILISGVTSTTSACLETTPAYAAPDLLCCQRYSFSVDLWACGVIMYNMLNGKHPFMHGDRHEILSNACKGIYSLNGPHMAHISSGAKSLLSKLLEVNPDKRIGAREVANNPWFTHSSSKMKTVV